MTWGESKCLFTYKTFISLPLSHRITMIVLPVEYYPTVGFVKRRVRMCTCFCLHVYDISSV